MVNVMNSTQSAPVVVLPDSAPFSREQRAWLNGYLLGLLAAPPAAAAPEAPVRALRSLAILYGSQTGTAEQLAKRLATEVGKGGFAPRVLELNAHAQVDWTQERVLLLVTSTWGDGDPPDNAVAFWQHLQAETAPRLEQLSFAVLGLGDRNYSDFCGAARKFDERLAQLGARRLLPRVECDTDYETAARAWMTEVTARAAEVAASAGAAPATEVPVAPTHPATPAPGTPVAPAGWSKARPYPARLVTNRRLNGPGSAKDTRHFEIALGDSGLVYEAGDALGVQPTNCPRLVDEILLALHCDGEEAVPLPGGGEASFRQALRENLQITKISGAFLAEFAGRAGDAALSAMLEPGAKAELDQFLHGREIMHLLAAYPRVRFTAAEFAARLPKLQPRLYSISSSPNAHAGEVHLTVAVVRYESHGRAFGGVCSTFLAERATPETPVPVFVHHSPNFRVPRQAEAPMIMIGPGTGIAPFRAFLEERQATGAPGKNWLFFGDQSAATDFLYRAELETLRSQGVLTRLDTAFSRDQAAKIYVQQRLLENAAELWAWLAEGAHVYVCGDAKRMARDVDAALHQVIQTAGGKSPEAAADFVRQLKQDHRYQRDVY